METRMCYHGTSHSYANIALNRLEIRDEIHPRITYALFTAVLHWHLTVILWCIDILRSSLHPFLFIPSCMARPLHLCAHATTVSSLLKAGKSLLRGIPACSCTEPQGHVPNKGRSVSLETSVDEASWWCHTDWRSWSYTKCLTCIKCKWLWLVNHQCIWIYI